MDSGFREDNGLGCLTWFAVIIGLGAIFLTMVSGDSTSTSTNNTTTEVLSRNQANIASEVYNSYYDCLAAGSCVTITTETSTSTATTSTSTDVSGNNNTVNGLLYWCANAEGAGYWTQNQCDPGYTRVGEGVTP